MSSLERIYRLLEPLRIYALRKNSLIDHELEAYAAGFSKIEQRLGQIRQDIFPQTAGGDALSAHEARTGLPVRAQVHDGERRSLILDRRIRPPLPVPCKAVEILEAAGFILPVIREIEGKLHISALGYVEGVSEAAAWELAANSLPAHLEMVMEVRGKDWNSLDAEGLSWLEMDEREQSWYELMSESD